MRFIIFLSILWFFCIQQLSQALSTTLKLPHDQYVVRIFHLIDNALWGEVDGSGIQGNFACSSAIKCEIFSSDIRDANDASGQSLIKHLQRKIQHHTTGSVLSALGQQLITVTMYNIHTWKTFANLPYQPNKRMLPSMYTMVESEESHVRFNKLFTNSFVHFDGNSTTSPSASVPRIYFRGWNMSEFLLSRPFSELINGSSFVASTCHEGNTRRMTKVRQLRQFFRVDGLGKCLPTRTIVEGVLLTTGKTEQESLQLKRQALSRYKFYLAFENTNERGYVTEKIFDALLAGTIPVYLGSTVDCRALLPDPKAAIFASDLDNDMSRLASYLRYLSSNETAYEEHRAWRQGFDPERLQQQYSELMSVSWPCRLCQWAVQTHQSRKSKQ